MDAFLIAGRGAYEDAAALIEEYGEDAALAAAARAATSRGRGNVQHFCHWRQIERMIAALNDVRAAGTIH